MVRVTLPALAILFATPAFAGAADDAARLTDIKQRIALANPECADGCGKAVVIDHWQANAWTDGEWIWVSRKMMAKVNDDELAFVIAHEIGHHVSRSTDHGEADRIAVRLTQAAGFNPLAGADMLGRYIGGRRRAEAIRAMVR